MKSFISIIIVSVILILGAFYEQNFIIRQFEELNGVIDVLYEKIDQKVAVEDDVIAVRDNWLNKKKYLHIFISHNEIKEIDLWISEAVTLVRDEKWEDAISKIEVLKNLSTQIPKNFVVSIENIM